MPRIKNSNSVAGIAYYFHLMGNHHNSEIHLLLYFLDQSKDCTCSLRIECTCRLIAEKNRWINSQCTCNSNTLLLPTSAQIAHTWSQQEPWLEYACTGDIGSCKDGEVMTVVKNRSDEYTVRILHEGGYESVYSGLDTVSVGESSVVTAGQTIGTAAGFAAFELRKDGLSVLPVFSGS